MSKTDAFEWIDEHGDRLEDIGLQIWEIGRAHV